MTTLYIKPEPLLFSSQLCLIPCSVLFNLTDAFFILFFRKTMSTEKDDVESSAKIAAEIAGVAGALNSDNDVVAAIGDSQKREENFGKVPCPYCEKPISSGPAGTSHIGSCGSKKIESQAKKLSELMPKTSPETAIELVRTNVEGLAAVAVPPSETASAAAAAATAATIGGGNSRNVGFSEAGEIILVQPEHALGVAAAVSATASDSIDDDDDDDNGENGHSWPSRAEGIAIGEKCRPFPSHDINKADDWYLLRTMITVAVLIASFIGTYVGSRKFIFGVSYWPAPEFDIASLRVSDRSSIKIGGLGIFIALLQTFSIFLWGLPPCHSRRIRRKNSKIVAFAIGAGYHVKEAVIDALSAAVALPLILALCGNHDSLLLMMTGISALTWNVFRSSARYFCSRARQPSNTEFLQYYVSTRRRNGLWLLAISTAIMICVYLAVVTRQYGLSYGDGASDNYVAVVVGSFSMLCDISRSLLCLFCILQETRNGVSHFVVDSALVMLQLSLVILACAFY